MTTAMLLTTPNHKMVVGHDFMNSYKTPSRMDDSLLHKIIFSTPNNFPASTPITPSSPSQSSAMSKYVNLGTIGEGSYGLVLKCKDRQNGRIVAIKKFIESEEDKSVRKIAMREIHLLKQLRHENLVNLLEVFRRKRRLYLVFEFVEKSLLDHLEMSPSGLERGHCRRILYQVIRALEFCHIHNIIHRDVKPENILISKHGVVKLCDFGFARTLAKPGEIYTEYVSTRWYRAPELLVGDARYGRAVDIWALGCLSAEMLTGQPLFPGDSDIDQLFSIVKCFGCLCRRHEDRLYSNPMFRFEISQIEVAEPLKCRLRGCTSREFQFVSSCLELDPQDRPTCSSLMRHPLFTCDGFASWFPEELQEMLRKDADEHKLRPERPRPKRQLPDLNKCLQLSSTPIKGYGQVTSLNHHEHTPDHNRYHHAQPTKDLPPGKTHRNLEEAFGSCTIAADESSADKLASHDEWGRSSLNFDLRPLDLTSTSLNNDNNVSSTCPDLDSSFSHLGIGEGIEVEGEESPRKSMNINEEDDYASEANEGDYTSEDDYAEDNVRVVHVKSQRFNDPNEDLNCNGDRTAASKLHPVSLLLSNSQKKLNNNNNKNTNQSKRKQNNKAHQSLPMSSSSSSSASSSSPMTSLPSPSSSATTSGVSSPTSSSSSSSSSCSMRKFSKNSINSIKHFSSNNNNRNNINNINNNINNINNNNNKSSSNSLNQSLRGSQTDVTPKSQNQKLVHQPPTTNTKNNKHVNNYKPDSNNSHHPHHHYQHQQQHQQQGRTPCKPLQQKNVIHQQSRQQQQPSQQQSHCKQVENESPKFGQKSFQQPKHQNSHERRQQNVQPKPGKKKDFGRRNPSTTDRAAKRSFVPTGANDGQAKIGFRNS